MGTFRTTILLESAEHRRNTRAVNDALVDTGREYTWVPRDVLESLRIRIERTQRFVVADGRTLKRPVGFAIVHAAGTNAPDLVVFAEPGDMVLLGSRSLEGMNLRVDSLRKQLVPAGPVLAGAAPFSFRTPAHSARTGSPRRCVGRSSTVLERRFA